MRIRGSITMKYVCKTLKRFDLNNRGCNPTEQITLESTAPKWAEHCFRKFNHFVAGLILLFNPWVSTHVY